MFKNLQSGSVIYDLAAVQGGNTAFTEVNKIVEKNGVKILGEANILNKLPVSASNLIVRNLILRFRHIVITAQAYFICTFLSKKYIKILRCI